MFGWIFKMFPRGLNNVRMAWWLSICTTSFRKKKGKWFKIENIVVEQRPESQADGFIKKD
jgi:hypothetical protein